MKHVVHAEPVREEGLTLCVESVNVGRKENASEHEIEVVLGVHFHADGERVQMLVPLSPIVGEAIALAFAARDRTIAAASGRLVQ